MIQTTTTPFLRFNLASRLWSLRLLSQPGLHSRICHKGTRRSRCGAAVAEEAARKGNAFLDAHDSPRSAYIHLPFCKRRCYYCDFPIQAVGPDVEAPSVQQAMQRYVDLLCREINATAVQRQHNLGTVFFGGGTPSLIPEALLEKILQTLDTKFGLASTAEISMEADPGTFDQPRLQIFKALGVNRLSVGVQAFQEETLRQCGRSHGLSDVYKAIEDIHSADIANWSLDLISGLPNTSVESWQSTLAEALRACPTHISVYDLQVEEKTKFGKWYTPGQFPLPDDDSAAAMYCSASEILGKGGMEHYEVSSYALPGYRCQHNMVYWSGAPFHAFGLGAASYLNHKRFSRPKSMAAYKGWVKRFQSGDGMPGAELSADGPEEQLLDTVMLRLRMSDGLDLSHVEARHGRKHATAIRAALARYAREGLVVMSKDIVALKDPEGFLVSNSIISDIFSALDG